MNPTHLNLATDGFGWFVEYHETFEGAISAAQSLCLALGVEVHTHEIGRPAATTRLLTIVR